MSGYKNLARAPLSCLNSIAGSRNRRSICSLGLLQFRSPSPTSSLRSCYCFSPFLSRDRGFKLEPFSAPSRSYDCVETSVSSENAYYVDETTAPIITLEPPQASCRDTVEDLLSNSDDVSRLMKMERRPDFLCGADFSPHNRWFPYLNKFNAGTSFLSSDQVLEALDPYILEVRKEKFRNAVKNRSYSVCLVVEGLSDFGNVSAAFRSADALGFQSVHVVSCDNSKRYKDNRHVSMGSEKWLDIELWNSTRDCFQALKSRGYCIATTHLREGAVSVYDMDWSRPTAIVVGNENRGISDEALHLSDLHCCIPMKGMVDSFNVSVAAGLLMHHAVCDRTYRLGQHGDLTLEERQILLAEFSLRHSKSAINIAIEYANRNVSRFIPKL